MTSLLHNCNRRVHQCLLFALFFLAFIQSGYGQASQLQVTALQLEEGDVRTHHELPFQMIEILYPDLTVGASDFFAANVVKEDNISRLLIYKLYAGSGIYVGILGRYGGSNEEIWVAGGPLGDEVIVSEFSSLNSELSNGVRALGYTLVNNSRWVSPEDDDNTNNDDGTSGTGGGNSGGSSGSDTIYGIVWCEGEFKTTESAPWTSGTLVSPNFRILDSDRDMTDEEIIFYFKKFANNNTLMEISGSANCQVRTYTNQSLYDGYRDSITGPVVETISLNIMSRDI